MPSRFLNYLLQLLRDEIFHHTVYNSHAKSWGSNPGTSQSDNSAIYQDATLKFDMRPSLFLMYFFFLWPKEKHDFWKVDRILRIKRNFKTKFGLLFCVYFDWLARTNIKNTKISKNGERKNCLPMARFTPRRSPIQVLTTPDVAWLQWSDENWYFHPAMAVDTNLSFVIAIYLSSGFHCFVFFLPT